MMQLGVLWQLYKALEVFYTGCCPRHHEIDGLSSFCHNSFSHPAISTLTAEQTISLTLLPQLT